MKKFFAASALLALAAIAQASTASIVCPDITATGAAPITPGSGTATCPGLAAPGGNSVTSIRLDYQYDATFAFGDGSADFTHNWNGTNLDAFNNLVPVTVTKSTRPVPNFIAILNPTLAQINAVAAGGTVEGFWANTIGSVTGVTVSTKWTIEYSPEVPEPGTYAMMGAGLLALAAFRKRA